MIYVVKSENGEWKLKKAVNNHKNHTHTPRKSRYISMYRKDELDSHVRRKLFDDIDAGARFSQIHNRMALQKNDVQNMAITKKDLHNVVLKYKRLNLKDGDAKAILYYFTKMTEDNQNFFNMHMVDTYGSLKDFLWVDARSRASWEEFRDVVCFDATYLINKYEVPFANFVGVNHHGQSILLACALVSHEDT